jgi:hypothetical protein
MQEWNSRYLSPDDAVSVTLCRILHEAPFSVVDEERGTGRSRNEIELTYVTVRKKDEKQNRAGAGTI